MLQVIGCQLLWHTFTLFPTLSNTASLYLVHYVWNVMVHAQKPNFVFRRNGRVHLNWRRASVQSTTGSRGVRISGSNVGYTKFRGSEGNWLPTPFANFPFTSPPVRHHVPSHFNWTVVALVLRSGLGDHRISRPLCTTK